MVRMSITPTGSILSAQGHPLVSNKPSYRRAGCSYDPQNNIIHQNRVCKSLSSFIFRTEIFVVERIENRKPKSDLHSINYFRDLGALYYNTKSSILCFFLTLLSCRNINSYQYFYTRRFLALVRILCK